MTPQVVFLLEELSAAELLEALLPKLFPGLSFLCVPHNGKSNLKQSIPRKLRAWKDANTRFVVLIDQDNDDCLALKRELVQLCHRAGRPDTIVRIVCRELEAWYLGDPQAMAQAFDDPTLVQRVKRSQRLSNPDLVVKPSEEVKRLVPSFGKVSGARAIGDKLDPKRNRSHSFGVFIQALIQITCASSDTDASIE
ncbi:MAG: DUF4276 family protein [Thermoflexales bacterium]|nr:DUF4276 family protein [Thermoflexales bacterium]